MVVFMNIKLGNLIKSRKTCNELKNLKGLDSITAYRIAKNIQEIQKELSIFDEQNVNLLNKYCERDDNNKPIVNDGFVSIPNSNKKDYEMELKALFEEDVELSIKKISLGSISNVGLTPAEILSLEYMLDVEE